MDLGHFTWLASYAAMLLGAAWWDAVERRVPNAVVLSGAAVGLAFATLPGGIGITASLSGLAAGLAIGFPFYLLRAVGAGDAKLIAAVGAFVGYPKIFGVVLLALLAGGVLALAWALAKGRLRSVLANVGEGMRSGFVACAVEKRIPRIDDFPVGPDRVPYAVAIAIGAVTHLAIADGFDWMKGF